MNNKEDIVNTIASNAIDCIETIVERAAAQMNEWRSTDARALATVNTFNDLKQVGGIGRIGDATKESLQALLREPVVSRVSYEDEDGNHGVIYVTRASPTPIAGFKVASYRSPNGRIASIPPGQDFFLIVDGRSRDVVVRTSAQLHPHRDGGEWDSIDNHIEIESLRATTVRSLRALLAPVVGLVPENLIEQMLLEEDDNVIDGIARRVISRMGLRDQPILDQHQDEIFRLPINSQCFLAGPPGTGKTTTLIRRLGQKLDRDALQPAELRLVEGAAHDASPAHRQNWVMFSPTELLRQYVKEAFIREGVPALDQHIRTWTNYRRDLARNTLGILRTATGRGQFIEREDEFYLARACGTAAAAQWYDDFEQFYRDEIYVELHRDAEGLQRSEDSALAGLGVRLLATLTPYQGRLDGGIAAEMRVHAGAVQDQLDALSAEADKIVNLILNRILHDNRSFMDALQAEVARQVVSIDDDQDDEDEIDGEEDDEEEDNAGAPGRLRSKRQLRSLYDRTVRAYARAKARGRRLSERGRYGRLVSWLGADRLPNDEEADILARLGTEQTRLRKFAHLDTLLIRRIPLLFRRYRRANAKDGRWYVNAPARATDICWKEVDLLILAILRVAGSIFASLQQYGIAIPATGRLGTIFGSYKNQVLVDEATDFSVIQLAAMFELSHPSIHSFFACGDFNQRLTTWGISSEDELDWISARIARRSITVSYRQSARLVALAKGVAALGGAADSDIVLPDRVDIEGVPPVWRAALADDEAIAAWLADRIREIELRVGQVPTIAVLVNGEERVSPLAARLDEKLQAMNLSAAACRDGEVIGHEQDVRVFNLQHIKGMEFEAVFFIGLDEVLRIEPDLYNKYLYVGATRAATYLGITFGGDVPGELQPLAHMFAENWNF